MQPTVSPSAEYSTCGRISCFGVRTPGKALRCRNCGNSQVVFHRAPAPVEAPAREPMSRVELEARAIARAREEHVHIRATARPGVYTTVSKSDPTAKYTLVASGSILACSCKGFEYRKVCKHSEALRNRLAREARRSLVAA